VAEPFCEYVELFEDGDLAPARKDGLWGYVNTKGQWVIAPQFNQAWPFYDELALASAEVGEKIKYGYINKAGEWVVNPIYDDASFFYNGAAIVVIDDKGKFSGTECLIDRTGRCFWKKKLKYTLFIQRF
jgi:hypothetical protein